jgi:hypothetical protein
MFGQKFLADWARNPFDVLVGIGLAWFRSALEVHRYGFFLFFVHTFA